MLSCPITHLLVTHTSVPAKPKLPHMTPYKKPPRLARFIGNLLNTEELVGQLRNERVVPRVEEDDPRTRDGEHRPNIAPKVDRRDQQRLYVRHTLYLSRERDEEQHFQGNSVADEAEHEPARGIHRSVGTPHVGQGRVIESELGAQLLKRAHEEHVHN
jgi:hypothetical protein